jgi:GTPase
MYALLTHRYFKTTLYGLSGCAPDYVMLMVGGNAGLIGMSKEHLGVALALNVPIAVCVTKVGLITLEDWFR